MYILVTNIKYVYTLIFSYISNLSIKILLYLGHSDVVTINDALRLANQTLYIITAAGDCTAKVWIKPNNESKFFIIYVILISI